MSIEKVIRKKLKESKKTKQDILIEQQIVRSRLMMILGEEENIEKFEKLDESEKDKIAFLILMEIASLKEQGFLNEQEEFSLGKVIKSIFGPGLFGAGEAIIERAINWLLSGLGLPDNSVKKFLISFFATNPSELYKSLSDCKVFVKHLSRAIVETLVMNLQVKTGIGGTVADSIRNAIAGYLQKTDFGKTIETELSTKVCELIGKYSTNAEATLNKLKTAVQPTN